MKLSAIVITKNEEATIERCLKSLGFADEIIVVDAESTDATTKKATAAGARVFVRPWPGYGEQKNFGRQQAHGEWLLFVDADEEVTSALADEITHAINTPTPDFYWLKIVTVFLRKPLRHLYGHNPRLFRRTAGQWTEARVHEQVVTTAGTQIKLHDVHSQVLTETLLHHSHATVGSYLTKMHRYTTLDAQEMHATNRHRSGRPVSPHLLLAPALAVRQFVKMYGYRHGWRDGYAGLIWCILSAYYEWEMAQKYRRKTVTN